jgi:hypothetical protein
LGAVPIAARVPHHRGEGIDAPVEI